MVKRIPKDYFDPSKGTLKLLWEEEWRGLGITQVCPGQTSPLFDMWADTTYAEPGMGALRGA